MNFFTLFKTLFFVIFLLLILSCKSANSVSSRQIKNGDSMKLETSIHLMNKGDFQGALKILIDLHRSDINQHQVGFTLGVCYYNMRLHEKAIKAFEKDLLTDANPARTHYMLAMIYEHRGKTKKALLHWRKFVATGKNDYMIKAAKAHLSVLESRK